MVSRQGSGDDGAELRVSNGRRRHPSQQQEGGEEEGQVSTGLQCEDAEGVRRQGLSLGVSGGGSRRRHRSYPQEGLASGKKLIILSIKISRV